MKRYTLSMADSQTHIPAKPNNTAYRMSRDTMNFDMIYQEWPNRESMLKTIMLQESGKDWRHAWKDWSKSRMAERLYPSPVHNTILTEENRI